MKYKIKLTTVGPLFVGSGEKATKMDYFQKDSKVYIPNTNKLFKLFKKTGKLDSFSSYLSSNNNNQQKSLQGFLGQNIQNNAQQNNNAQNNRTFPQELLNDPEGIREWREKQKNNQNVGGNELLTYDELIKISRKLTVPQIQNKRAGGRNQNERQNNQNNVRLNDIHLFTSDSLTKKPYVPGSSLKGLFMNILNNESMHKSISISDSELIESDNLVLCQKIDFGENGSKNGMPLFRECIKPGIEIKFDLTIYNNDNDFVNTFQNKAKEKYKKYYTNYLSKYKKSPNDQSPLINYIENDAYCYLSGGAGFRTKTIHNDNDQILTILKIGRITKKHYNNQNIDANRTPIPLKLKMTKIDNHFYEFGKVKIEIKE